MEIQIIIRAPNQNIDDQIVNCNTDWTILKLKNHLSQVYPNKPIMQEQKLIYSGRLLHDHLQLQDIIRHDDSEAPVHILHLVCNESTTLVSQEQIQISSQDSSDLIVDEESDQAPTISVQASENVLRHRPHSFVPQPNNYQLPNQQIPITTFPVFPSDPQLLAQMAAMQQMYAQYLLQYWESVCLAASTGSSSVFPVMSNLQQDNSNSAINEMQVQQQQQINQRVDAPRAQAIEENDVVDRDWLDNIFVYIRFLILLSIIYFYSTPERLMIVIVCAVIAFLYHEGWFVRRIIAAADVEQRNVINEANPNAVNEEALPNQNMIANHEVLDGHELEAAMDGDEPPHAQNPDIVNNNQVFSPLTFFTTFFSSLIPEPPPPVNIN